MKFVFLFFIFLFEIFAEEPAFLDTDIQNLNQELKNWDYLKKGENLLLIELPEEKFLSSKKTEPKTENLTNYIIRESVKPNSKLSILKPFVKGYKFFKSEVEQNLTQWLKHPVYSKIKKDGLYLKADNVNGGFNLSFKKSKHISIQKNFIF